MYTLTENEQFAQNAVNSGNYKYEVVGNLSGTHTQISNPKTWASTSTSEFTCNAAHINDIVALY